jgi:hypothetical protein
VILAVMKVFEVKNSDGFRPAARQLSHAGYTSFSHAHFHEQGRLI